MREKMTPTLGDEIQGESLVDLLAADPGPLRAALALRKLLVFRDQPAAGLLELLPNLGEPYVDPFDVADADGLVSVGAGARRNNGWHTDGAWRLRPPSFTVLVAREVPSIGGDTVFADMTAAFRALPGNIQEQLRCIRIVHTAAAALPESISEGKRRRLADTIHSVCHPVARRVPETGEVALFGQPGLITGTRGSDAVDVAGIVELLRQMPKVPEFQCRIRWKPGTIVLWDNRSVQHYAVADYSERRVMQRWSARGEVPVGDDGQPSAPLSPERGSAP